MISADRNLAHPPAVEIPAVLTAPPWPQAGAQALYEGLVVQDARLLAPGACDVNGEAGGVGHSRLNGPRLPKAQGIRVGATCDLGLPIAVGIGKRDTGYRWR